MKCDYCNSSLFFNETISEDYHLAIIRRCDACKKICDRMVINCKHGSVDIKKCLWCAVYFKIFGPTDYRSNEELK